MTQETTFRHVILAISLLAIAPFTGCRNPGAEGQGQTHTPATPDNQQPTQPHTVPTPPTADRFDPSAPKAVLGGTSTTSPSNGVAGAH